MRKSNFILSLMAIVMMVMCPALLGSGAGTAQAQHVQLWVGDESDASGRKQEISSGVPVSINLSFGFHKYCIYINEGSDSYYSASITRSNSSNIGLSQVSGPDAAATIEADVDNGDYTFTVSRNSNNQFTVSVTYPEQSSGGSSNPVLNVGDNEVVLGEEESRTYDFTPGITGTYHFHENYNNDVSVYGIKLNDNWLTGEGSESDNCDISYSLTAGNTYQFEIENQGYSEVTSNVFVSLVSADLNISEAKYATYYNSKYAYTMPSGCKGYIWDKTQNKLVETYAAGSVVPADEPLVIYSETAGTKTLTSTTTSNAKSANNALLGTDEATTLTEDNNSYFYGLSLNQAGETSSVGFYWMNETGAAFTNGAHKAYLKLAKSSGVKAFYAFNDSDVDAIEAVTASQLDVNAPVYNIAGQRVSADTKGILIQNGKKFINK